jgi:hypothetical protein
MKIVNIEVLPAKDGEVVTAIITEETQKSGSWKEGSKSTVQSGTPEAKRTVLLDDDDRVIIEGRVEAMVTLDKEQSAAKRVFVGEKAEEQKKWDKSQEEKFEKMNKDEKERLEKEKPQEAKLRAEQEKARDEAIMGKKEPQDVTEHVTYHGGPQSDAGLRTDTPADSKTVKNETSGSTTKPKGR